MPSAPRSWRSSPRAFTPRSARRPSALRRLREARVARSVRRDGQADLAFIDDRAGHRGRRGRVSVPPEWVSLPRNRPLSPMDKPPGDNGFSLARSEDRLVWIFGSSRSGSTWLLRMLSELDDAVAIDDPHLGHHLGVWRPIPLAWATADHDPELTLLNDIKR